MKKRFQFTRPKNKNGQEADYFFWLKAVANNSFSWKDVNNLRAHMTFQCLREANLIKYDLTNSEFQLTDEGTFYVKYVNSINVPDKFVLKTIMGIN